MPDTGNNSRFKYMIGPLVGIIGTVLCTTIKLPALWKAANFLIRQAIQLRAQ